MDYEEIIAWRLPSFGARGVRDSRALVSMGSQPFGGPSSVWIEQRNSNHSEEHDTLIHLADGAGTGGRGARPAMMMMRLIWLPNGPRCRQRIFEELLA